MRDLGARRRVPALDGLRGLALLAVFAHQFERVDAPAGLAARLLATLLDRGWVGVQLFFVLSGFLITGLLMDGGRSPGALGRFFQRRALRILPLYGLLLAALLWLLPLWPAVAGRCGAVPAQHWPFWLLVSNWTEPFATVHDGCLVHLWSLAVEEQFYLLWPLLVAGRGPRAVLAVSAGVFALACVARPLLLSAGVSEEAVYTWSLTRMDALAAGAAVAAWLRMPGPGPGRAGRPLRLATAALVVLGAGWFVTDGFARVGTAGQAVGYPLLAISFAALLAAALGAETAPSTDGARRLRDGLSPTWLQVVGRHSYAMYLLHRPFDLLVGRPLLAWAGLADAGSLAVSAGYTAFATLVLLALAHLVWRWIEAPCLRLAAARGPSA